MKEILIEEMQRVFGTDQKRICHALSVLDYAERILTAEQGDAFVVTAAAILHDIGIGEAERKYGSSAGKYQEIEGPPIAEEILKRHKVKTDVTEHICRIIANHHSAKDIDTPEFRIIWDADWIVNLQTDFAGLNKAKIERIIRNTFKTRSGREIASEIFLKN